MFFVDVQPIQRSIKIEFSPPDGSLTHFPTVTFKKYDLGVKFVNGDNPADFAKAIDDRTKAIFVESIGNPKYNVAPIPELAKVGCLQILKDEQG